MFTIYVIESEKDGIWYTGFTQDIERRIQEHNSGKSKFTSGHMPWRLIYSEMEKERVDARKKEKYLKSAAGKKYISKQISKS